MNRMSDFGKDINVLTNDTIYRQAAIAAVEGCGEYILPNGLFRSDVLYVLKKLPSAQPELAQDLPNACTDAISRQAAIDAVDEIEAEVEYGLGFQYEKWREHFSELPSAQPETAKYEYHYDHTNCIWYRPEARNRCPTTCAQYRDGWNDAMNYIFRDGKGYRPYRRDEKYE